MLGAIDTGTINQVQESDFNFPALDKRLSAIERNQYITMAALALLIIIALSKN